jgi:hypothetical protein
MGMTDRQFDIYLKSLLINLKRSLEEIKAGGGSSETLEMVIKDLEDELKRP